MVVATMIAVGMTAVLASLPARAAPPMEPQDMIAAFDRIEQWVRAGAVDETALQTTPADLAEFHQPFAVCITLRLADTVLVEAAAHAEEPDASTVGVVALAADRALIEARRRMGSFPKDMIPWDQIAIGVEAAGPPIPIDALQIAEASLLISPGTEGVAARLGDRLAMGFPAAMLRRSHEPGPVLASLVVELSGNGAHALTPLPELRDLGFDLYRFETLHLAQRAPGTPPGFLFRGGRVVPSSELGKAGLNRFARGLASNLIWRSWPGVEAYGMTGTYDAGTGTYEEPFADPPQQAITALALMRASKTLHDPALLDAATDLLTSLAEIEPDERAPWLDPLSAAVCVIALTESVMQDREHTAQLQTLMEACTIALDAGAERATSNAAVALAMHRLGDPRGAEGVRAILRASSPEQLPGQMPWLAWAAIEMASDADRVPGDVVLRRMRTIIWDHQIRAGDTDATTRDLNGGIVFTDSPNPLPTWQAARPLVGVGAMLGDPRLTERQTMGDSGRSEYHTELARLIASLRFLRQLAGDPSHGAIHARVARGQWGIRLAPWDQRMPPAATALTLLAVVETLEAIESIKAE